MRLSESQLGSAKILWWLGYVMIPMSAFSFILMEYNGLTSMYGILINIFGAGAGYGLLLLVEAVLSGRLKTHSKTEAKA